MWKNPKLMLRIESYYLLYLDTNLSTILYHMNQSIYACYIWMFSLKYLNLIKLGFDFAHNEYIIAYKNYQAYVYWLFVTFSFIFFGGWYLYLKLFHDSELMVDE